MKLLGALILPIVLLGAIIIYKILLVVYEDERNENRLTQADFDKYWSEM